MRKRLSIEEIELRIRAKCAEIADVLAEKNRSYGGSALNPLNVFSQADAREGLAIRIDDKLARQQAAPGAFGEDQVLDLTAYLVLYVIAQDLEIDETDAAKESVDRLSKVG